MPGEDEDLHVYLQSATAESLIAGVARIKEIMQEAIDNPTADTDLRRQQMRELALLNGTLRDNVGLVKLRELAEAETVVTNQIVCERCGGRGHIEKDCMQPKNAQLAIEYNPDKVSLDYFQFYLHNYSIFQERLDTEYASLMTELGQDLPAHLKREIADQQKAALNAANGSGTNGYGAEEDSSVYGHEQYTAGYGVYDKTAAAAKQQTSTMANPAYADIQRRIQQTVRTSQTVAASGGTVRPTTTGIPVSSTAHIPPLCTPASSYGGPPVSWPQQPYYGQSYYPNPGYPTPGFPGYAGAAPGYPTPGYPSPAQAPPPPVSSFIFLFLIYKHNVVVLHSLRHRLHHHRHLNDDTGCDRETDCSWHFLHMMFYWPFL